MLTSTIKAAGDFTKMINRVRPGERAFVRGPFGRFSHLLHGGEGWLVFLVGGIGITPIMSMLRHMRDAREWKPCLLMYGNKTEVDIVFRRELDEMVIDSGQLLKIVHVLSRPEKDWKGEQGHITTELVQRYAAAEWERADYYICGPAAMPAQVSRGLNRAGVPVNRIHSEMFSL